MGSKCEDRLTEIFSRACRLGAEERAAYLDTACAGHDGLREEVESLLAYDERAGELVDPSVMRSQIRSLMDDLPGPYGEPAPPERVGPYRILGLLGEGGQGIVFKAEQPDPRRIVALKLLRAGPLVSRGDVRRFRKEIQALALLRHPAIATIFEGNRTDEGEHYFAMEYVDGDPINTFVRDRSLSLAETLELFCAVCDGVHYAHEKRVIHRDLKPSNILVDGERAPKILDFGLARMAGPEVTAVAPNSETRSIVGSFRYMSPEQTRATKEEVGTQTDVYSLGVVLYELLTGSRPYELGSSLPEAVLTICETPPPPPSSIDRRLRGDLDTIVLAALEKEPSRRYESAAHMAADIRRHLRGESILARRPGWVYPLRKGLRRHRIAVSLLAAALVLAGLVFGLSERSRHLSVFEAREKAVALQSALESGGAHDALGGANRLYTQHQSLPEVRLVLAQGRLRAGETPGVVYMLRHHGGETSGHAWAYRMLLSEVIHGTDDEAARELENGALRDFPDTADAWHLRSFTTFDLEEAIRCSREALTKDPHHVFARSRLAYLCTAVEDYDCARIAAQRLLESHPSERRRVFWMRFGAWALMRQGDYRAAIERYDALLAKYPSGIHFHRERALVYLCLEDYESAIADYSAMMSVHREASSWDQSWSRRWRATPLWILGRLDEASEDLESYRRIDGVVSHVDARLYLLRHERARRLRSLGELAEANQLLDRAWIELGAARRSAEGGSWLEKILECLAGEVSPAELIRAADHSRREQVCEAYYYAAEVSLLGDRIEDARRWFRDCVATGLIFDVEEHADPMSEYHLARWRVRQLEEIAAAGS